MLGLSQLIPLTVFFCCWYEATVASPFGGHSLPDQIGQTPAFMPAVKRCFFYDNVKCYEQVLEHFTQRDQVKERHLAQLPALAAQMGAIHIFKHLKNKAHSRLNMHNPHWNKWMTRAAARKQWSFVKTFAGRDSIPSDVTSSPQDEDNRRMIPYHISVVLAHTYTENELEDFNALRLKLPESNAWSDSNSNWVDRALVLNQKEVLPTVKHIWSVLAEKDLETKTEALDRLKQNILDILSGGEYLMDDILPDPQNIVALWLNHYDMDRQNNMFLQFLLNEGAPINDAGLILTPLEMIGKPQAVCESVRDVAIRYASGSGTKAFANELYFLTHTTQEVRHEHFAKTYVEVANANIVEHLVLERLIPYLAKYYNDDQTIQYLVDHGLDSKHIKYMFDAIHRLPHPEQHGRYNKAVKALQQKVREKKGTWSGFLW